MLRPVWYGPGMETVSHATFAGRLGQQFWVAELAGSALTLTTVAPLTTSTRKGGGFRLEFTGAAETMLPQGSYQLSAEGVSEAIFIVPIGRDADNIVYEAVFN